jgi:hypothetical protein
MLNYTVVDVTVQDSKIKNNNNNNNTHEEV